MNPQTSKNADLSTVLERARALVFDFDGTLVDSNEIKWRGFEATFFDFPDNIEEIVHYCRQFNHTARSEKFRHVYEVILGLPYTSEIEAALLERFAVETTQAIVQAPEIPGVAAFLCGVRDSYKTAVLSSTPTDVLLEILGQRGWLRYFHRVEGAPIDKAEWLRAFRYEHRMAVDELVFFGDAPEDAYAAASAKCTFVAVESDSVDLESTYFIEDFRELLP